MIITLLLGFIMGIGAGYFFNPIITDILGGFGVFI